MQIGKIRLKNVSRRDLRSAVASAILGGFLLGAACAQSTPKMQLPADRREYDAARGISDPAKRVEAFENFVGNNPKSLWIYFAQSEILQTLVKFLPDRTEQIDRTARAMIDNATTQQKPYLKEYFVADLLADAGPHGVDLPLADSYAKDALRQLTEPNYVAMARANEEKYHLKPNPAISLHHSYIQSRSRALAAMAHIDLDEGRLQEAEAVLDEADELHGHEARVSLLEARVALLQHDDASALADFERSDIEGGLKEPWLEQMHALYARAHGGSQAGLTEALDNQYAAMFSTPFTAGPRTSVSGGHTALLELFTGSGCAPCVAADVSAEAILEQYGRSEVVVLEQDLHIPDPDPLANPDTEARGDAMGVRSTPSFLLDGTKLPAIGGAREESQGVYDKVTSFLDKDLAIPGSVKFTLKAHREANGTIQATAEVTVGSSEDVGKQLGAESAVVAAAAPGAAAKSPAIPGTELDTAKTPPSLKAYFALVEDHVRYSGENGIRFHRMVVRSIFGKDGLGQAVPLGSSAELQASFDPAVISAAWEKYLSAYEKNNERFGRIQFLSKDTSMNPDHLAIAVWVQDEATHRVLGASFFPLAGER